jgi:hypothetical protein
MPMPLALAVLTTCLAAPLPVLHLTFDPPLPYLADAGPNHLNGLLRASEQKIVAGPLPGMKALLLDGKSWAELPGGRLLLGERSAAGTLALWCRPDFDFATLPQGTWDGWVVIAYIQKHSGNGLPDGYNEIGLSIHAGRLFGKVYAGSDDPGPFPGVPCPLKPGQWTHLAVTWTPDARSLYVDGKLAAQVTGALKPVELDDTPMLLGCHPPTHRWLFTGALADVRVYDSALSPGDVGALMAEM